MGQLGKSKDGAYPDLTLNEAVELIKKMDVIGGPVSLTTLAKIVGIDPRGAGLRSRVEDLKAYGLVEENGGVKLSGLGRDVARDNIVKTWEAFMNIPLYSKLHERLEGRDVEPDAFHQILYEITRAEVDAISRRQVRLKNNYMEALKYFGSPTLGSTTSGHGHTQIAHLGSGPLEMMSSDIAFVDKDGKLFIVIAKNLSQVQLAKSFLASVEESLSNKKQKSGIKKTEFTEPLEAVAQ